MFRTDASPQPQQRLSDRASDILVAGLIALAALAFHAATGFAGLVDVDGDNDALMRLVQIRALMEGQGWYDLQQYRMGLEGGFPLHWSRLADMPVVLLMLAARGLGLAAPQAEAFAMTAWPLMLFGLALYLIVATVRRIGGSEAVLPAFVLGAAALHFTGEFAPGAIDHHNFQLVLVLAMLERLTVAEPKLAEGLVAGCCAALSIAIGMETAPYVAAAGLAVALAFLFRGEAATRLAVGFGAAFFAGTALAFAGLLHPSRWGHAQCDALSSFQLAVAAFGGLGLALLASPRLRPGSFPLRLIALAALGLCTLGMVLVLFPQCLASPYAGLDPRLRELWLDHVTEARSLPSLASGAPHMVLAYYVTPLIGLSVLAWAIWRRGMQAPLVIVGGMLAVAFAVSAWQVRGSTFSIPLAVVVLAMGVGAVRVQAGPGSPPWAALALVGAWLISTNAVWAFASNFAAAPNAASRPAEAGSACYSRDDYRRLARLPAGTVLASSNLGASILAHTPHRALAGPYHRNEAGNLATLDMLMAAPSDARERILALGVDYVAVCPGNAETPFLAARASGGLLDRLAARETPDWLEAIDVDADLIVFSVRRGAGS